MSFFDSTLFRFLIVGVLNTLACLLVIYLSMYFLKIEYTLANGMGYIVGLSISFVLNSKWTFDHGGSQFSALIRFLLVFAVSYCLNLLAVIVCVEYLNFNAYASQLVGIPIYSLTFYLGSRYFAFSQRADAA